MTTSQTKGWKLRSTRQHEPHDEWIELQYKFVHEFLKTKPNVSIGVMGDYWVFFDTTNNDVLATIDGEKGETLVY